MTGKSPERQQSGDRINEEMNQLGLIKDLEAQRGWPVGKSTFYDWLRTCGIVPKGRGLATYEPWEVDRLKRLVSHLNRGGSYSEFQEQIINEEETHGNGNCQQTSTSTPIECIACEA